MRKPVALAVAAFSSLGYALFGAPDPGDETFPRPEIAVELLKALDETLVADESATVDDLRAAIDESLGLLAEPSPLGERLQQLRDLADAGELRSGIVSVRESLAFEPVKEGDMPKDFPTFTPTGVVEVKEYPAYRRAEGKGFFTLFRHITLRRIAMTVPVEVQMPKGERGRMADRSMAFLYGDRSLGEPGRQGQVTVVDVSEKTVVALGVRGESTAASTRRAREALDRWLAKHDEYEAVGELVYVSYNGPGVPVAKRVGEYQFEVRRTGETDE